MKIWTIVSSHTGVKEAEGWCLCLFTDLDSLAQGVSQVAEADDNF